MNSGSARILVLGSTGRLGTILRRYWGKTDTQIQWHGRRSGANVDHFFDLCGSDPFPSVPSIACVLALAGIVPGAGDLSQNIQLGSAAVRLGARLGARHVVLSSSAAVYGGGPYAFAETPRPRPPHAYGAAKLAMEDACLTLGAQLGIGVTALRIGNVAGADALLAQPGNCRVLDKFDTGLGPMRSYVGPRAFADLMRAVCARGTTGQSLPPYLNLALHGAVNMADLCHHAGLSVTWRDAPPEALAKVELDVSMLCSVLGCAERDIAADPAAIVADWRADQIRTDP